MATKFLVIGLPASFTSEQLRDLLRPEVNDLHTAEMLPDTIALGVGYVKMANDDAKKRVASRFSSLQNVLGVRPLICNDDSVTFHAFSRRWEAARVPAS
jgi:hypothetical protein